MNNREKLINNMKDIKLKPEKKNIKDNSDFFKQLAEEKTRMLNEDDDLEFDPDEDLEGFDDDSDLEEDSEDKQVFENLEKNKPDNTNFLIEKQKQTDEIIKQQIEEDEVVSRFIDKLEKYAEEDREEATELYNFLYSRITEDDDRKSATTEALPETLKLKQNATSNLMEVVKIKLNNKNKRVDIRGGNFLNANHLNINSDKLRNLDIDPKKGLK
jgi:predicted SprT family Zn-dependent metalloprotease